MGDSENIWKRIESEQRCMKRITNNDMVCRSCIYKYDDSVKLGNTSTCEKYDIKPNKVINGEDCDNYQEEEG